MKLVIKGLICDTKLDFVIKEGGFHGYAFFMNKMAGLQSSCDFYVVEEENENFVIVKLHNIKEEPVILEIPDYPAKPNREDMFGLADGEEVSIRKVVCWQDGSVLLHVDKLVSEVFSGQTMDEVRRAVQTELKIRKAVNKCDCDTPKKKKFTLFGKGKEN